MKKVYKLEELDCANCAAKMEAGIKKLDGVEDATVSFLTQKMTIVFADGADVEAILQKAAAICRKVEPDCRILL